MLQQNIGPQWTDDIASESEATPDSEIQVCRE